MTRKPTYHRTWFTITPCLFTACLLVAMLFASAHAKTADGKDLLQFTSKGHILGFSPGSMYMASGSHMLKVEFLGGKSVSPVSKEGPSSDGKAPPLSKVTYPNIWDGVDIVYEGAKGSIVKSTYTVAAGKAPGSIRLRYNRPLTLDEKGNLVVRYETGTITESKPIAWQVIEGKKKPVMVAYNLQSDKEVGFTVKDYDKSIPLVIDPSFGWYTFLGGSGTDYGQAIALDSSGNIYVAGYSSAAWTETPVRAYYGSGTDAFVAKLNPDGSLAWYTFLGGSGTDNGYAIALDSNANIYVTGQSNATWGSPLQAYTSGYDAFVAKLNASGSLVWHSFLGGSGSDCGQAIALDSNANIYVTGQSNATWRSPLRAYTSGYDAFVAKLTTDGSLVWHSFLGGSGTDNGYAIALDSNANIYVTGRSSATWESPVRAYTSGYDAFVAKLTTDGSFLWNTFLGGSSTDYGQAIALDSGGNIYVAGYGSAAWTETPVRAYDGSGTDAFVARLNPDGSLVWHTFLGGSGTDYGQAITLDSGGNIYVTGRSNAAWTETPERAYTSGYDAFVARLTTDGNLTGHTFLGGSGTDYGYGVALDSSDNIYVTGCSSTAWTETPVRVYTSSYDAFVARVMFPPLRSMSVSVTGAGTGTVTSSPSGINCGSTCSAAFSQETTVTLTAVAGAHSVFTGWTGGGCSGNGTCVITLAGEDITVTAEFSLVTFTVGASVEGGHGTVSPDTQAVTYNTSATITMTPDPGYHVAGVSDTVQEARGAKKGSVTKKAVKPAGSAPTYTINRVTANHAVVVTYEADPETLTARKTGTGSGTLSASGLTCSGLTCSGTYGYNTTVTITATPDTGSSFTGWTGCDSTSGLTCVIAMTATRSVTANFDISNSCTYAVSWTDKVFGHKGGSANITLRATGGKTCANPEVASEDAWVGVSLSAFKNNKGTVKISVLPNDGATERTGTVSIRGNAFHVVQAGAPCSVFLPATSDTLDAEGGPHSFAVNAPTGCAWSVSSSEDWLTGITSAGTGTGLVSYIASGNTTGKQRSGKITVFLTDTPSKKKVFTVKEKK